MAVSQTEDPGRDTPTTKRDPTRATQFEIAVLGAVAFVLSISVIGIVFGIVGWFNWFLVSSLAVMATAPVVRLIRQRLVPDVASSGLGWGIAVIFVLVVSGLNLAQPGEQLLTGRDPATYLATAGWVAGEGQFLVDARVGPFAEEPDLSFAVPGFYDLRPDGRLAPEFFHALPALLAIVGQVGGLSAMLLVNPIVGGLALLAVYAMTSRLTGSWAALVALFLVGLSPVFTYFTRETFTEPLALMFTSAGFLLLFGSRASDVRMRFLGGVVLGGAVLARIDALLLIPVLTAGVVWSNPTRRESLVPTVRGFVWVSAFALAESMFVSPWYVGKLDRPLLLIGGATVGALAFRLLPAPFRSSVAKWVSEQDAVLRSIASVALVSAALFALFIRPVLGPTSGGGYGLGPLLRAEGLAAEAGRSFSEYSFHWLLWYLGPVAVVLGIGGLVLMLSGRLGGRHPRDLTIWLAMTVLVTAAYLWRPSINPDHIWVMRRFLPVAIPGIAVAASVAVRRLGGNGRRSQVGVATLVGLTSVIGLVPAYLETAGVREFAGLAADFQSTCEAIGADGAVLVIGQEDEPPRTQLLQSFRSYCGIPAAGGSLDTLSPGKIEALGSRWTENGRRMVVVAGTAAELEAAEVKVVGQFFADPYPILEYRLTSRPKELDLVSATVWYGWREG